MRYNDIVDLIQYNTGEDPDDDYGTVSYKECGTVVVKDLPVSVGSLRVQGKLLQNQDQQWEKRYLIQHKVFELKNLRVDAVRRHSTGEILNVYWDNTTGTDQTVSYKVEYRDIRRDKEDGVVWQGS